MGEKLTGIVWSGLLFVTAFFLVAYFPGCAISPGCATANPKLGAEFLQCLRDHGCAAQYVYSERYSKHMIRIPMRCRKVCVEAPADD